MANPVSSRTFGNSNARKKKNIGKAVYDRIRGDGEEEDGNDEEKSYAPSYSQNTGYACKARDVGLQAGSSALRRRLRPLWYQWAIMILGLILGASHGLGLISMSLANHTFPRGWEVYEACGLFFSWTVITLILYYTTITGRPLGLILKAWWSVAVLSSMYKSYATFRAYLNDSACSTAKFEFGFAIAHLTLCCTVVFFGTCFNWEPRIPTMIFDDDEDVGVEEENERCPEDDAGLLSNLTFWWLNPLMTAGYDHALEESELMPPSQVERPHRLYNTFEKEWENEKARLIGKAEIENPEAVRDAEGRYSTMFQPSLARVLRIGFGLIFYEAGVLKWIYDTLTFVNPLILNKLTTFLSSDNDQPLEYGWLFVATLFVVGVVKTLILHQYFQRMFRFGMRIRAAMIVAVYQKALRLSQFGKDQYSMGEVVTLMSTDAQRLQDVMPYFHIIWSGPYQIIICLILLYYQVGWSMLAGLGVMLLMVPLNGWLARKMQVYQRELMTRKENRIKITDETIKSIKVLKLYAWESSFGERIQALRDLEVVQLTKYMILRAFMTLMWAGLPIAVAIATFTVFTMSGNDLTAARAFTALSLFSILRFPLTMFPAMVSRIVEAKVSVDRLELFLAAHELQKKLPPLATEKFMRADSERWVGIQGRFFWGPELPPNHPYFEMERKRAEEEKKRIMDGKRDDAKSRPEEARRARSFPVGANPHILAVSTPDDGKTPLIVKPGALAMVVGRTGCGKSALLGAILGELEAEDGAKRSIPSFGVAYASQVPWICNATVRENIIFGNDFNKPWYEEVIEACALKPDFKVLGAGDQTEIGENGVNLSGGQKQRIALARAVYSNCGVYLLDDTLSAVDAHVGRHIFEKCIRGILKDKTVVLVTHNLHYLAAADQVILIENGHVIHSGSYAALISGDTNFARYISEIKEETEKLMAEQQKKVDESKSEPRVEVKEFSDEDTMDEEEGKHNKDDAKGKFDSDGAGEAAREAKLRDKGKLMTKEKREKGHVAWRVYDNYFQAMGGYVLVSTTVVFIATATVLDIFKDQWLSVWSEHDGSGKRTYYLSVYSAIAVSSVIGRGIYAFFVFYGGLRASRVLHSDLRTSVMRAPMWFHDTTSCGSILNRFSHDIYTIDELLPTTLQSYASVLFRVLGILGTISYVTPMFLAALAPMGALYYYAQMYYIAASRCLKRWDSILRSPIYAHFGETISGLSLIRSFSVQRRFAYENTRRLRKSLSAYFPSITANRWLAVRLEFVGTLVVTFAAFFAVLGRGSIPAALAALSISYAMQVTQSLNWLVRMTSQRENSVVSVERIGEYIATPSEMPLNKGVLPHQTTSPSPTWPEKGKIEIKGYWLRYLKRLPWVLRGVNAIFSPGEKVGIVGRTGAGKSTLLLALLRLVEVPNTGAEENEKGKSVEKGEEEKEERKDYIGKEDDTYHGLGSKNVKKYSASGAHESLLGSSNGEGCVHDAKEKGAFDNGALTRGISFIFALAIMRNLGNHGLERIDPDRWHRHFINWTESFEKRCSNHSSGSGPFHWKHSIQSRSVRQALC